MKIWLVALPLHKVKREYIFIMSTIKCPNCGNTLPEDSAFCNRCGSRIETEARGYRRDYEDWSDDNRNTRRDERNNKNNKMPLIRCILVVIRTGRKHSQ